MKQTWKKIGIILAAGFFCWVLAIIGGLILADYPDSAIGGALVGITSLAHFAIFIWLVVVVVKAISSKSFRKTDNEHKQYQPVAHNGNPNGYRMPKQERYSYYGNTADELNWPLLILLTVAFPPIGVYYIIKKILTESLNYFKNGTKLSVIGGVFTALALLSYSFPILNIIAEGTFSNAVYYELIYASYFLVFSLFVLISGLTVRHIGLIYDRILYLITVERITKISELSVRLKLKQVKVIERVSFLINNRMLLHAYYYPYDNEVIVAGISKKIAIRCRSCAATTVLYSNDKKRQCVYCGAEL